MTPLLLPPFRGRKTESGVWLSLPLQGGGPGLGVQSEALRRKAVEARFEVGLEVFDLFEPAMQAERGALLLPGRRAAIAARIERQDQAFETAPGIAHPEQAELVEHRGELRVRDRLQHDREQARSAG